MKKVIKIGVVGFSRNQFDKKAAYKILNKLFEELEDEYCDEEIEIVSGYTNSGIPKIAYEVASEHYFTTVGFSAKQALNVRSGVYPVDKEILVGQRFGDESAAFIEYIDGLIRVGGGPQSRKETTLFKEKMKSNNSCFVLEEHEIDWFGN